MPLLLILLKKKAVLLQPEIPLSPNSHFPVETVVFVCDFEMQCFFKFYPVIAEQTICEKPSTVSATFGFKVALIVA